MTSKQTITQIDAFTNRPYSGNAAAICVLTQPRNDAWMQQLAEETNQPATVFVQSCALGYGIRWFTPFHELPLCGHGTLAAAHALWTEGYVAPETAITFHSRANVLTATREGDWIILDFPAIQEVPVLAPEALLRGLRVEPHYVGKSYHSYLVEVSSEAEVRAVAPDIPVLASLDIANVIVTSRAEGQDYDFVSRFFAPSHGIAEDPATGSAHCCLGPYWSQRLGKTALVGYQASARGGTIRVEVRGDRVALGGQAVTISRSELCEVRG